MEKNREERSLLAEQREQEKEQVLASMQQLQEEDLRVTRPAERRSQRPRRQGARDPGDRGVHCFSVRHLRLSHRRP